MRRTVLILAAVTMSWGCSAVEFGATDQPETDSVRDARGPSVGLVDAGAGGDSTVAGSKAGVMAVGQEDEWGVAAWQYVVVSRRDLLGGRTQVRGVDLYAQLQEALNRLGAEGWELCHIDAQTGDMFVFKRPAVSQ